MRAEQNKATVPDFESDVLKEMALVDEMIKKSIDKNIPLVMDLSQYILDGGRKRVRPLLVLLAAKALGYTGETHVKLAAVLEMIHTATLLHDDVVDSSEMRRGRASANIIWGNEASVLVGDYLYSRAFQLMVDIKNHRILEIMADTTNTLAIGEVMQLVNKNNSLVTEELYLKTIDNKTGKLFETAAALGGVSADCLENQEINLKKFGRHLGLCFQLVDDALDYSASLHQLGKNIGDDLAEGKPTLPLMYALWHGKKEERNLIKDAIEKGKTKHFKEIIKAVKNSGGIEYTLRLAKKHMGTAQTCLKKLPETTYQNDLHYLLEFALTRQH
ncbi:MAG: polyprenyl synthetase family protein [Pseudomonadota bacterium]|nr:polyprenyl synthetase family protein [Pseudomonadota bacterium]